MGYGVSKHWTSWNRRKHYVREFLAFKPFLLFALQYKLFGTSCLASWQNSSPNGYLKKSLWEYSIFQDLVCITSVLTTPAARRQGIKEVKANLHHWGVYSSTAQLYSTCLMSSSDIVKAFFWLLAWTYCFPRLRKIWRGHKAVFWLRAILRPIVVSYQSFLIALQT